MSIVRFGLVALLLSLLGGALTASANHSWGGYHWAHGTSTITVLLGDNVGSAWDSYLRTAASDWNISSVLDTKVVAGKSTARTCRATAGRVEVCNYNYGSTGWLGIASVWVNSGGHITQGTVKMNDTYFSKAAYNTPAWRNLVMCQEVGHTFGLGHQDENFYNSPLNTCMDYTSDPTPNQHPNAHDYEMLEILYSHIDNGTSALSKTTLPSRAEMGDDPRAWGEAVRDAARNMRTSLFEQSLGRGEKVYTFVVWADPEAHEDDHNH